MFLPQPIAKQKRALPVCGSQCRTDAHNKNDECKRKKNDIHKFSNLSSLYTFLFYWYQSIPASDVDFYFTSIAFSLQYRFNTYTTRCFGLSKRFPQKSGLSNSLEPRSQTRHQSHGKAASWAVWLSDNRLPRRTVKIAPSGHSGPTSANRFPNSTAAGQPRPQ